MLVAKTVDVFELRRTHHDGKNFVGFGGNSFSLDCDYSHRKNLLLRFFGRYEVDVDEARVHRNGNGVAIARLQVVIHS